MNTTTRLMNKNFLLLWQGQLVSILGSQAGSIGMIFWIKHATNSATLMGLMGTVSSLVGLLLAPIGGVFADHYSRRAIIIWSDLFRGMVVLLFSVFLWVCPEETSFLVVLVFIGSMIHAMVLSFFGPAIQASIPDLVPKEKLSKANALNTGSAQAVVLIGQGMGGALFAWLGALLLFFIDGITYLFAALSACFIEIPQVRSTGKKNFKETLQAFKKDMKDGFFFIWQREGLRMFCLVMALLNFFSVPITLLLPFYIEDFLHLGPEWFGFVWASFGGGALGGYALAGMVPLFGKMRQQVLILLFLLQGVALSALVFVFPPPYTLVLVGGIGVLNGFINVSNFTVVQQNIPSEMRGRVLGILGTFIGSITPLAMALSGIVADLTGQNIPLIYGVCGGSMFLVCLGISTNPPFRAFLSKTDY